MRIKREIGWPPFLFENLIGHIHHISPESALAGIPWSQAPALIEKAGHAIGERHR